MKIKNVTRFLEEEELNEGKVGIKMKPKVKKMKGEEMEYTGKKQVDKKKWKYKDY